jgi:hypothetical protein
MKKALPPKLLRWAKPNEYKPIPIFEESDECPIMLALYKFDSNDAHMSIDEYLQPGGYINGQYVGFFDYGIVAAVFTSGNDDYFMFHANVENKTFIFDTSQIKEETKYVNSEKNEAIISYKSDIFQWTKPDIMMQFDVHDDQKINGVKRDAKNPGEVIIVAKKQVYGIILPSNVTNNFMNRKAFKQDKHMRRKIQKDEMKIDNMLVRLNITTKVNLFIDKILLIANHLSDNPNDIQIILPQNANAMSISPENISPIGQMTKKRRIRSKSRSISRSRSKSRSRSNSNEKTIRGGGKRKSRRKRRK